MDRTVHSNAVVVKDYGIPNDNIVNSLYLPVKDDFSIVGTGKVLRNIGKKTIYRVVEGSIFNVSIRNTVQVKEVLKEPGILVSTVTVRTVIIDLNGIDINTDWKERSLTGVVDDTAEVTEKDILKTIRLFKIDSKVVV